jgi:hypothetical protein
MKKDGASLTTLTAAKVTLVKNLHALAKKDAANNKMILSLKLEQSKILHKLVAAKKVGTSEEGEIEAL